MADIIATKGWIYSTFGKFSSGDTQCPTRADIVTVGLTYRGTYETNLLVPRINIASATTEYSYLIVSVGVESGDIPYGGGSRRAYGTGQYRTRTRYNWGDGTTSYTDWSGWSNSGTVYGNYITKGINFGARYAAGTSSISWNGATGSATVYLAADIYSSTPLTGVSINTIYGSTAERYLTIAQWNARNTSHHTLNSIAVYDGTHLYKMYYNKLTGPMDGYTIYSSSVSDNFVSAAEKLIDNSTSYTNSMAGQTNTDYISSYWSAKMSTEVLATKAKNLSFASGKKGFIPAVGQLYYMHSYASAIQAAIDAVGGNISFTGDSDAGRQWSSTQGLPCTWKSEINWTRWWSYRSTSSSPFDVEPSNAGYYAIALERPNTNTTPLASYIDETNEIIYGYQGETLNLGWTPVELRRQDWSVFGASSTNTSVTNRVSISGTNMSFLSYANKNWRTYGYNAVSGMPDSGTEEICWFWTYKTSSKKYKTIIY